MITVLSLFDGMSCGQIALNKIGIKKYKYYASEIKNMLLNARSITIQIQFKLVMLLKFLIKKEFFIQKTETLK